MFSDVGGLKPSFVVLVLLTTIVGSTDKTLELPPNLPLKKKKKRHNLLFALLFFFLERRNTFVPHMEQHFSLVSLLWCSIAAPLLHPFIQTPSGYCLSQTKYIAYKYTIMIFHEFFVFSSVGLGNQSAMATLFIKLIPLFFFN